MQQSIVRQSIDMALDDLTAGVKEYLKGMFNENKLLRPEDIVLRLEVRVKGQHLYRYRKDVSLPSNQPRSVECLSQA